MAKVISGLTGHEREIGHTAGFGWRVLCFYRVGDRWLIGDKGGEKLIEDFLGMKTIHSLLRRPREPFPCLDLVRPGEQTKGLTSNLDLPEEGEGEYRVTPRERSDARDLGIPLEDLVRLSRPRLTKLKKVIVEEMKRCKDDETRSRLKKAKNLIERRIKRGSEPDPQKDKARQTVQGRISRAMKSIHEQCPGLRPFINSDTIHTGEECYFDPTSLPEQVEWELDSPYE